MKKLTSSILVLSLSMAFLVGCTQENDAKSGDDKTISSEAQTTMVSLKLWEGKWKGLNTILDTDELKKAASEEAKKEGVKDSDILNALKNRLTSSVGGLEIKDDNIIFYGLDNKTKLGNGTCAFQGTQKAKRGEHDIDWNIFQITGDTPFAYIALSTTHGDEGYAHFHAKFGANFDELFKNLDNDPTYIQDDTPLDVMTEEIFE